jgi:exonuclease III
VRGINSAAKKEDVKQTISIFRPDLICVQETKLQAFDAATIAQCFGSSFVDSYVFLPARSTREGIVLAVNSALLKITSSPLSNHSITPNILDSKANSS